MEASSRHVVRAWLAPGLAAVWLCACAGGASKPALPPVTPIMIPPPMAASTADLVGPAWHWQGPEGAAAAGLRESYTLEFTADGRALVRADCNRGSGRYTQDPSGRLTLTPIATTKMACPAGSLDTQYLRQLGAVEGYRLEGDTLLLTLRDNATGMRFLR